MNERVQELSHQAEMYARSDNVSMLFEAWQRRYTSKLVELIIADCQSLVETAKDKAIDEDWNVDESMSTALVDIQEHFGINE